MKYLVVVLVFVLQLTASRTDDPERYMYMLVCVALVCVGSLYS